MTDNAVSDTGPFIHLNEVSLLKSLNIFKSISIPPEVKKELIKNNTPISKKINVINLNKKWRLLTQIIANKFEIGLGESEAIALCLQEKADYFLTDDLDARETAKYYNIKTHGTIGVILGSFRKNLIDKKNTITKLNEIYEKSSLFITKELINSAISEVNNFKK